MVLALSGLPKLAGPVAASTRLVLYILAVPAPVCLELKRCIEDRGCPAVIDLVKRALRLWQAVRSIQSRLMAARATHRAVNRDPGIEEQLPSQFDTLRRYREFRCWLRRFGSVLNTR